MKNIKKLTFVGVSVFMLAILGACGNTEQQNETEESAENLAGGTMLAGEEAPEITGTLKSIESNDEVVITVSGDDVTYRLSEEAKTQLENKEVELGNEITFTTFSIGDAKESVAEFIVE
ncbi:hypothetical protein [Ureibacillus manganicus]|uniref:Lipoprotein n=1 Tax=Ureibacillus manganicus DSM 26584 TaxID=1384049 RepID=A0A0A3I3K8_9BACL|nr:hypothetical protein [Ureibacillus manganicus]KGR77263.1 hypothetical protein CD29_15490 [Ureibacillus manganicus DSM 26584]